MRIKLKDTYYYFLFIWLIANYAMRTGLSGINTHLIGIAYRAVTWGCLFCVFFRWLKYVNDGWIPIKQFLMQGIILGIMFLSYFKSGRDELFLAMIFIVGAVNTEREKRIKTAFYASIAGMFAVIASYSIGIININVTNSLREGISVIRYSMGFSHPNAFATLVLQFTVFYIYIFFSKVKTISIIILLFVNYCAYKVTYSRTSFLLSLLFLMLVFGLKNLSKQKMKKMWSWILNNITKIALFAGAIGTVYIAVNYEKNLGILSLLESGDTLQTRVRLWGEALKIYPVTFWGQVVNVVKSSEYDFEQGRGVVLDNAYLFSLLSYGIIPTSVLVILYYKILKYEYFRKSSLFIICIIVFVLLGFTEKYFVSLMYNFTMLGLADVFYEAKPIKRKRRKIIFINNNCF